MRRDTSFSNALMPENRFVADGRMEILPEDDRIFCPGLGREGVMLPGRLLSLGE